MRRMSFIHQFSYYLLPRWLRRKFKKLRHKSFQPRAVFKAAFVSVVLVVAGGLFHCQNEAIGQTVNVGNHRTVTGHTPGSSASWDGSGYSGGVAGNVGTYVQTGNWFGYSAGNNVIVHLNGLSSTGGTVNISQLDIDTASAFRYTGGSDTTGTTDNFRGAQAGSGPTNASDPASPWNHAYVSTFSGSVNVGAGLTTNLMASYGSGGIANTGNGQLFEINGTLTKTGAGRLSIQTNTDIDNVTGSNGTLDISGNYGKIISTGAVEFNGGTYSTSNLGYLPIALPTSVNPYTGTGSVTLGENPVTGIGANSIATFTFTSGGNTGTANSSNAWTISNPITSDGINNMGYMSIGGSGTNILNGVTNIGMRSGDGRGINNVPQNGVMNITGAVDIGTTAGTHYLNINNSNSALTISGAFDVGTITGSSGAINHMWGGTFTTGAGTSLGEVAGSNFTANVANSTWGNTGHMSIGESGKGVLNIFSGLDGQYNGLTANAGIVNTDTITFGQNVGSTGYGNIYGNGSKLNVLTDDMKIAEYGTATVNVFDNAAANVNNGDLYVAKHDGTTGNLNIFTGGDTTVSGDGMIAQERGTIGVTNVWGSGSTLTISGDLYTAQDDGAGSGYAQGSLYAWDRAQVTVGGDHVIADGVNALGRDYIDMHGTAMNVGGALVVGNEGQAGGTYTEVRIGDPRYAQDPANGLWLDALGNTNDSRSLLTDVSTAKTAAWTGNDPGLAITRGALVTSQSGQIAVSNNGGGHALDSSSNPIAGMPASPDVWSNGYVVIDNTGNTFTGTNPSFNALGTAYVPLDNNRPFVSGGTDPSTGLPYAVVHTTHGTDTSAWLIDEELEVGVDGNAFLRVLNGGSLVTGLLGNTADSTVIASGSGRGQLFVNGNDSAWGRSFFKSYGATVVGDEALGRGTLRVYDGALAETAGLYIGTVADSEGEVFVDGEASTLRITADNGSAWYKNKSTNTADRLLGSGLFGATNGALVWLDADAAVRLNGDAVIASGAVLHLDNAYKDPVPTPPYDPFGGIDATRNPLFDVGSGRLTVTNARVEGIGLITGEDGVHFRQDDVWTEGQAAIDPGLVYGWETRCEKDFYGDLTFGHTLNMSGNVITYFDVNSGYYDFATDTANQNKKQDHIYVQADPLNATDQVKATLSGELMLHARLTDYYENNLEYDVVTVMSANSMDGVIDSMYDTVTMKPWRFFDGVTQEIRQDDVNGDGNLDDTLYVTMTLNENPFEDAAQTYNQRNLGQAFDSIYAERDQRWLPFLRYFWYLEDPEFLEAYTLFSGEIRAHSLLLPKQNLWTYTNDRNGFNRCNGHAFFGPQNRSFNRVTDKGLWGTAIYDKNETSSDGNAGAYDLSRIGFVVGYDRALKHGQSYIGAVFAYNKGEIDAYRSEANAHDFQFGLYHGKLINCTWEWKNYFGMGIQDYHTRRDIDLGLSHMVWNGSQYVCTPQNNIIHMMSDFTGFNMAGSTELARPFYFGECKQWTIRPYGAIDLQAIWQNGASEYSDSTATYDVNGTSYLASDLVALDFHSSSNVRIYARPGVTVERGGSNGNLRAGVSYSFLLGGRRYTNVDNQFQFGGDQFNIRGVDDGSGFVTANVGAGVYLNERKLSMLMLDYWALGGSHSTTHAFQLGYQRNF